MDDKTFCTEDENVEWVIIEENNMFYIKEMDSYHHSETKLDVLFIEKTNAEKVAEYLLATYEQGYTQGANDNY